jgi:RecB family exonuclease
VIVYLPQQLSRHTGELLRSLATSNRTTVLAGSVGAPRADAEVVRAVSRALADPGPQPPELDPWEGLVSPATTRVLTASDADDEVRAAVRAVVDAARAGTRLDRIAVLHAAAEPYARLLREQLGAAGLTVNGTADVPLSARAAGRVLLGLLALPAARFRRHEVLAWLTQGPIRVDGRPAPTAAWERISRKAGVVADRREWSDLLAHHADQHDERADTLEADPEAAEWQVESARQEAARTRELRTFVLRLIDDLADQAAGPRPWSERVAWGRGLMDRLLGGERLRARWPDHERRALERIELALDRLAVLDDLEAPTSLDVFTRTLQVELDSDLGRVGRFGDGVLVGPVSMGLGVHLDLVVLVGMAEGTFPSTVRDDSLLPDAERALTGGELALRGAHADRLHHRLLAVVAGAAHQVLCVPRGDLRRSSERVPSRWVLDVASTLVGARWWSADLLTGRQPWLTHIASFDAGIRTAPVPATAQEHRLRRLLAEATPRPQLAAVADEIDPVLAAGIRLLDGRAATSLTRFDGNLVGEAVPSPLDRLMSATRLERWATCPFAYFVHDVLRVEPVESPEEELAITPLQRGNLVHLALEEFILAVLDRPEAERPGPGQAWREADHRLLAEIGERLCQQYEDDGLTGRAIFWSRDRVQILRDLDRFLVEDGRRRAASGAVPVAAELPFGFAGGLEPVAFPIGDGRQVRMRGKADRVDRATDGTLHVLDYKTGSDRNFAKLGADDPHLGGTHLQLAVYGQAARLHAGDPEARVEAWFWFTSAKHKFRTIGYAVTPQVLESVAAALATIVSGIEAGVFAPHPKPHRTAPFNDCWYCDPDFLGTGDLRRQWEAKAADPLLAPYLALALPHGDDATEEAAP